MKFPVLSLLLLAATGLAAEPAPASAPVIDERAARAQRATEQRLAYAASADYHPYDSTARDLAQSAGVHLDKGENELAIADARKGLRQTPHDIDLLIELAAAYRAAGDITQADAARDDWMALVDSILRSGDGRGFATALQVIDVREEYAVMRILRLKPAGQSLETHGESEFDVQRVQSAGSEKTFELYFNIDLPKKWLNRQFAAGK